MDLSKLLRKPPAQDYQQVDTFWFPEEMGDYEYSDENEGDISLLIGQHIILEAGQVSLNYYCTECEDLRTFNSHKEQGLRGIIVNKQVISIDCILQCNCGSIVHTWFLVEAEEDIRYQSPKVRILHFREKLTEGVKLQSEKYGEFSEWLEKANRAYRDGLGSGAIIYLRKVYESITYSIANSNNIALYRRNGNRRFFSEILKDVDEQHSIIPASFSENRYNLFSQLSEIIHGDGSEEDALEYFGALYTLVISILDNVNQKEELKSAVQKFNWSTNNVSTN
ncbi:hypothetical protein [Paenibacillus sp. DMB5]|uniref:hypothetical protein n=1 Tax=Paenibacillus sp. DMB5 TaxID=1780103 RepID=UPI00076CF5ED|nr:hypothetical protein [Paenibacillus sp. DMB5]KUP21142.1 hypothetical protein AWJ19_08030 [Paenibacillus sp. DMB5]